MFTCFIILYVLILSCSNGGTLNVLVMTSPASFPATHSGYKAYVKSLGFDLNNYSHQTYYMEKGKFMAVERRTIKDRINEAIDLLATRMAFHGLEQDATHPLAKAVSILYTLSSGFDEPKFGSMMTKFAKEKLKNSMIEGNLFLHIESLINDSIDYFNISL